MFDPNPILTSLIVGLLAAGSPCVIPLFPGYLAYLSSGQKGQSGPSRYFLGFFVLTGVLTMMLLLGGLIALASVSIGRVLTLIIPAADLVILILGLLLVFDINIFKRIPQIQTPLLAHPFANAFVYGLLYGPLALPCSGALVVSIFTLSLTVGDALNKLVLFLFFGLGFGLPLLILSFLAGSAQRWITRQVAQHARLVNIAGGLLLIGVALYDVILNWDNFRLMFRAVIS